MGPDSRIGVVSVVVPTLVVCAALVSAMGPSVAPGSAQPRGPEDVKIVTVDPDSQDRIWPYTSRQRTFETLTLPINVVVLGNDTRVRWFLMTGHNVNWNETEGEWQGVGGEEVGERPADSIWYPAHGATRYTYIYSPGDGYGGWVDESYQLHDGDYFGTRHHIRAYTGGRGNAPWTAIQAHHEYWDWFRLRHTVGSTAISRQYVERSFYGSPAVERVTRERFANGGPVDSDGWATVAVMRQQTPPDPEGTDTGTGSGIQSLAGPDVTARPTAGVGQPSAWALWLPAALIAGAVLSVGVERRPSLLDVRRPDALVALVAASFLTMPTLRWLSIAVERASPWLSPKVVAGLGYLAVAVGLPVAVVLLARETRAARSAPLASLGLGTGVLLDYALLGLSIVPASVVFHRLAIVLALGLLAAAGARLGTDEPRRLGLLAVGALVWVGVLVWPLLDLL